MAIRSLQMCRAGIAALSVCSLFAASLSAAEKEEGTWTNLLKELDPAKQAVAGKWTLAEGRLSTDAVDSSRLAFLYRPTGEYDYRVSFTRESGVHSIALVFVAGSGQATFEIDAWGEHLAGIQQIGGKDMRANATRVADQTLVNGKKYTALVQVRKGQVQAFLDGKLLATHKTDGRDLSMVDAWQMPDAKSLGIGAYDAATTFHSVEVREVSGVPAVASTTPSTKPEPTKPAPSKPEPLKTTPAPSRPAGKSPRVLVVIANQHFFYREYADPREELEKAGIRVDVAAGRKAECRPHSGSGEGRDGGAVRPDVAIGEVKAADYDAIFFSGGWGSSMYQYAFRGSYAERAYNGDRETKEAVNKLINDFVKQDKYVGGICHGVSVLAWSRVGGKSLLAGKQAVAPQRDGPAGVYEGRQAQPPSRWNSEFNGAKLAPAGSVGNPRDPRDDVLVDGKIITAEDDQAARQFGVVLARLLNEPQPASSRK